MLKFCRSADLTGLPLGSMCVADIAKTKDFAQLSFWKSVGRRRAFSTVAAHLSALKTEFWHALLQIRPASTSLANTNKACSCAVFLPFPDNPSGRCLRHTVRNNTAQSACATSAPAPPVDGRVRRPLGKRQQEVTSVGHGVTDSTPARNRSRRAFFFFLVNSAPENVACLMATR